MHKQKVIPVPTLVRCDAHPRKGVHGLQEGCFAARMAAPGEVVEQRHVDPWDVFLAAATGVGGAILVGVWIWTVNFG